MKNQENLTSPPQSTSQTQPAQSPLQRWLPTIVGIAIVVFGIGGFFVFQVLTKSPGEEKSPAEEMSAETVSWNTYRDEGFGFILRYPPTVNFEGEADMNFPNTRFFFSMRRTKDSETISDLVQLRIFDLPFSQMIDEVASFGRCKSTLDTQSGKATIVVALNSVDAFGHFGLRPGFEGSLNKLRECTDFNLYKDEIDYTNQLAIYYFILSLDGQTYRFELGAGKNYVKDGAKEIFDQILSTFKFIELDETANWKTYRNEEFGFGFEYPASIFELDINNNTIFHELDNFQLRSAKDGSIVGPARDISFTFRDDVSRCSELKKTFEEFGNGGEAFQISNIVGTKYRTGAEGEGVVYYCVEDEGGNTIFLIERGYLDNSYSSFIVEQPDFILSEKQDQLSDKILSTFKFID